MEQLSVEDETTNVGKDERLVSLGLGAILGMMGLRRAWPGLVIMGVGSYLLYRGLTGRCVIYRALDIDTSEVDSDGEPVSSLKHGVSVERSVTVNRPPAEVYLFWRNLENLPRFMAHLESVTVRSADMSHWVAKAPIGGVPVEWDARITADRENELIAWGSLPGSQVMTTGEVRFKPAPGDRGTEVQVSLEYAPPGGAVGAAVARAFNKITSQSIKEDLRRFKEVLETGETPSVEGQSSGRPKDAEARQKGPLALLSSLVGARQAEGDGGAQRRRGLVDEASYESFPASDPPSYQHGLD